MDYGDEERLRCGAAYYLPREDCGTEFHLLDVDTDREEDFTASRPLLEARFVAERVASMLRAGFPVQDGDHLRPCVPEDFAVLMRSPGPRLRHYARAFRELDIPCVTQEREDFFSTMEIAVTYSLLQVIDNPRQDVPLISVLRSPIFGFSPDRLALIRGGHPAGAVLCHLPGEASAAAGVQPRFGAAGPHQPGKKSPGADDAAGDGEGAAEGGVRVSGRGLNPGGGAGGAFPTCPCKSRRPRPQTPAPSRWGPRTRCRSPGAPGRAVPR